MVSNKGRLSLIDCQRGGISRIPQSRSGGGGGGGDHVNFIVTQLKSSLAFHRQKRSHYTSSKLTV